MHAIDTTSCVDFTLQNKTKAKGKKSKCLNRMKARNYRLNQVHDRNQENGQLW